MPEPGVLVNLLRQLLKFLPGGATVGLEVIIFAATVLSILLGILAANRERNRLKLDRDAAIIELRRLNEHTLTVDTTADFVFRRQDVSDSAGVSGETIAETYVVATLKLSNCGDGPLDLFACMVTGREFTNAKQPAMGLYGRNVEWSDYKPY
jgi:hypothetical protein